jgi:hypothetical protein
MTAIVEHNTHYTLTQGEAKTLRFYLEPTDAVTGVPGPVDLTLWTATLTISQGNIAIPAFTNLACTDDADQVVNKSVTRCSLTALQTAALPVGNLRWHLDDCKRPHYPLAICVGISTLRMEMGIRSGFRTPRITITGRSEYGQHN